MENWFQLVFNGKLVYSIPELEHITNNFTFSLNWFSGLFVMSADYNVDSY